SVLKKLEKNVQLSKVSFITENITVENKIEPNVEINIKDSIGRTNQVFTDNAGTAVMNLPVEEYSYTAYAKGEIITGNFSVTSINPTEVKITFLKTRNPLVISKQKVINLLVVSDTNVPIISASINIYKDGNLYLSNKSTNTQGIMSPSVSILDEYLTSSFFVIVTSSGYEKKIVRVNPIDINSLPTKIELKRGENKLTVSVIDDQNSPIKSAIVKVINTNFNLEINESENKTTNNNGVYILQNLPTGDYKISVDTTNASGEKTLKMDANVDKTIEIQLVTGMGFIRYKFVNEEGQKANPKILVYKLENDGNNTQIFSGFPKNGVYDTPKFLVGTKIKILIEDENYFNTETLVYTITRLTQSKEIYLRRINNLPNNNEVQMILEEVYASDPKYGNPAKVDVLLPGKNYFLYFNLLLNTDINAVPISIFYIGDKNKQVLEESSFSIENIDSIIEHITLIDTNMNGPFIDPNSQTITSEGKGKIGNVVFNSIKGKFSIPLILEIRVDENTQFGTLFYYTNFEDVDSLLYKFDFNVGKKFCTNKSKCDPFLFSNYIEHNSVTKPYEEGQTLLIGENYKLKSSIENISDVLYSNIDLVLEIPKEGVEYGLFSNDKNSVVFPLTLNPLSISVLKEETIKPIKARNVWSINQSAKKIIDGVDELKELNDTIKQRIKFSIKNKNTLDIVFSPSIIEERSNYPVFIVNTTIKNGGKISANWKAEKVLPSGETELINSGVTDGNGRQITSFNAINLVKGDIVKFTVFDNNGSNPGTKQITIGSGFGEIEVLPQECLSVKLNSIDLNKNAEYFLDSTINSSNSVEVISDCNEERYAVVKTDLDSSEISLIIPANSKKSFTITSKPRGVLLGAYPVQILSVNGARYSQISYFDIVISDPNSDFELSKAVFDFSEEDVLAGIVTNKKYSGRKDNFYPKMNISTNSVSLNYNKPGIPSNLTIELEVMATAWEAVSKGRTKSDKIKMTTKEKENWLCGDNKKTSITITHPTEIVNDDGITSAMQEWFEEVSSAEPTPKPEPELDETNPDKPYYSLPKEITDKFISKIIPIEGEVSDLGTDANFSENKKERKILLEGTTGGSAIMNYDLPGGENVLSGVIYDPTGVTNYQEVATFDTIYGCLIPPAVSNKVEGTIFEFYYSNLHDIEGNPIEKFKIPGQTEYVQLKNSCMLVKRVEQVNYTFVDVEKDEKTQIISYGFADRGDNGDCTGPRIYGKFDIDAEASCHVFSNNTDVSSVTIQTDAGDGGTYFFKRWKTWRKTVDLNNIEEGKIYPLGEYSATPELEYQGLTSINDKKAGDSWAGEDNKSFFTVPILGAHGFVPPEFVMENTQRICASTEEIAPEDVEYEKMPDPNSPWVEFDSTGLISYEITPWSIPDGFRVFLKDGVYYGEYLGNIKVDWDPSGADRMVYIQTEPEITSPNIDFTLTKIDLVGNEYAIITVQDWVSGSEKKEAIFQVKLKGPESTCVNSNGEDGYTGAKYIPKFLFKWDFSSINEEQCDST
ncbi:MAG TPA: carboxypeptidase-like regulatory domain-containing protein, partial [archaeon]|nr:carboxypeptidase-like regulatory domain-containing protein [archaeon]